jgi:hypothetical protein
MYHFSDSGRCRACDNIPRKYTILCAEEKQASLLGYFLSQSLCSSYNRGLSVGTQYDVQYVQMLLQNNVKDEDSFRNFHNHKCFIKEKSPAVLTIVDNLFSTLMYFHWY